MDQSSGSLVVGIVGSVVAQEALSRGISHVLAKREERVSMGNNFERLEWAHSEMEFVLERSSKLPITDISLLGQRRFIKRAYHECDELWRSKRRRALNNDQEAEPGVTPVQSYSSFPVVKKITLAAVRSVSSFFGLNKDELSRSAVRRFELFAEKAGKFMRDVESGCTLAHYRFFNPLVTQLLQGNPLEYEMVQANGTHDLLICPARTEEHGVLALLAFLSLDARVPEKAFNVCLILRLSENTDIFGFAIQCLQSVGPQFRSFSQVAIGELIQLPTQDLINSRPSNIDHHEAALWLDHVRPDPLCCKANVQRACANNVIPSELSYRFPEQVLFMGFECSVSAFDQYNVQSSADEAEINVVNGWPLLKVKAIFSPHCGGERGEICAWQTVGEQWEDMNGITLQQAEEMGLANAITCFIRQPELTEYRLDWISPHGSASFTVEKPKEKVRPNQRQVQDA